MMRKEVLGGGRRTEGTTSSVIFDIERGKKVGSNYSVKRVQVYNTRGSNNHSDEVDNRRPNTTKERKDYI